MCKPYTYLIGWTEQNIYYYGSKYGADADPETFWKTYFTSSRYVHEAVELYGGPDVIQIRKTFSDPHKALEWEQRVLCRLNVLREDRWLNKNVGGRVYQKSLSESHRNNIAKANSKPKDERGRLACAENSKKAAQKRLGQKDSEDTKRKRNKSLREYHQKAKELGITRKKRKKFIIEDKIYNGIDEVANAFDITVPTIYNRLKSDKFPEWSRYE